MCSEDPLLPFSCMYMYPESHKGKAQNKNIVLILTVHNLSATCTLTVYNKNKDCLLFQQKQIETDISASVSSFY